MWSQTVFQYCSYDSVSNEQPKSKSGRQREKRAKRRRDLVARHKKTYFGTPEKRVQRLLTESRRKSRRVSRIIARAAKTSGAAARADVELAGKATSAEAKHNILFNEAQTYERQHTRNIICDANKKLRQSEKLIQKAEAIATCG